MHVLPRRQEPGEGVRRDRFDLVPERRERLRADAAEHLGVAPLRALAIGTELALDNPPVGHEPTQGVLHDGDAVQAVSKFRDVLEERRSGELSADVAV
ncbi:hypothetical protein IAE22_33565, partial [Bacillus sp. S34]|nr:hypothetical protein [Bacillus sp. S34]